MYRYFVIYLPDFQVVLGGTDVFTSTLMAIQFYHHNISNDSYSQMHCNVAIHFNRD